MPYDWMMGVLADLRRFAEQNGMPRLAEHLHDTTLIAALEISNHPAGRSPPAVSAVTESGAKDGA